MQMQRPSNKPWEGMPLRRLGELKSFSDALEFSIYLTNKRNVRKFINRLQNELPKILAPIHIDLATLYQGRGGTWDAWGLYQDQSASVSKHLESTDDPTAIAAPPCRLIRSHEATPPIYSETDPNATYTLGGPLTPPTAKRPLDNQEEGTTYKKVRDDRASQWAWHNAEYPLGSPTEENTPSSRSEQLSQQSTGDRHSRQKDESQSRQEDEGRSREEEEVTQGVQSSPNIFADDQSTQGQTPPPYHQLTDIDTPTLGRPCTPAQSSCHNPRSVQTPPYAPSFTSAVSLDQINIKPTIFTTRPQTQHPSSITLTISELESLIANTIRAQIPLIAAHVQTHNLTTELTAWAQPSIADYIAIHMPAIMHEAASAHVSDVNDEFESASAALHETKEDAVTEIRDVEESGVQGVLREYQIAIDDLQEQSQRLSDALTDKCTELEDRLDAKMSSSAPPEYSRQPHVGLSSAKEAVKVFERFHRDCLTPDEQVRVLLSIAKFKNAEVFMSADLESRRMLVAHWSGRRD
jgi:hypothetical protein